MAPTLAKNGIVRTEGKPLLAIFRYFICFSVRESTIASFILEIIDLDHQDVLFDIGALGTSTPEF
jgi:hypothetical protein